MTRNNKAIFSDIDGTLCFHQKIHDVQEVQKNSDGTFMVLDKKNGNIHKAYNISPNEEKKIFFAVETSNLAHKLISSYDFICASGARLSTITPRMKFLGFVDTLILENGGLIVDNQLRVNQDWLEHLESERDSLKSIGKLLRKDGWILDDLNRTSAIRVIQEDNPHKTEAEISDLFNNIVLPKTLKKTYNMGNLDIILNSAGKDNAVNFVLRMKGYDRSQSVCIGDDINDIDFLKIATKSYVMANSLPEVIQIAIQNNWHIAKHTYFDGINEILTDIENLSTKE